MTCVFRHFFSVRNKFWDINFRIENLDVSTPGWRLRQTGNVQVLNSEISVSKFVHYWQNSLETRVIYLQLYSGNTCLCYNQIKLWLFLFHFWWYCNCASIEASRWAQLRNGFDKMTVFILKLVNWSLWNQLLFPLVINYIIIIIR